MKYILSLVVENKHGVLSKISQVITGRGYNISTLSVGPSESDDTSRMVITFDCDDKVIQQIVKQLNRLIDVIKVFLVDENERVERELLLLRIQRTANTEASLYRLIKIFRGKIVHTVPKNYVIEVTGDTKKINAFIENAKPYGIQDLMRTGPLALPKFDIK